MALTAPPRRLEAGDPRLILLGVLGGLALVVATTAFGSGDYGQWLMTARSFNGLNVPDYRAEAAVPPVVPLVLAQLVDMVGDATLAVRSLVSLLLCALGASAYFAGASLFATRHAGLIATVLALLIVDQFLDLFAFGGVLQAAAIGFAWLMVGAFYRAAVGPPPAWRWWCVGAVSVGLAALAHLGTASILVPAGCVVALLAACRAEPEWRARLARLIPLGALLVGVAAIWITALLPGGTDLTRNPASLDYRGPGRLVENLTGHWPTALVAVGGLAAIGVGTLLDGRRRRLGPWTLLAGWTGVTMATLLIAVVSGAATDYPRFATPLLAPLVVGAAGALAAAVQFGGSWLAGVTRRASAQAWSLAMIVILVVATAPLAAARFATEARGYQLRDAAGLASAADWMDANLSSDATVLAPVREAKWIEGLTGRAALFSNAFRYSFRAEEWQRSLAADTLLRSSGALVNEYFFIRLTATGSDQSAARGLVVAANHGGEYVELLSILPDRTRILGAAATGTAASTTLATLTNLAPAGRAVATTPGELKVETAWGGERQATSVQLRQVVVLQQDSSVLDVRLAAETLLPVGGIVFELTPAAGVHSPQVEIVGQEALLTFTQIGSAQPRLRVSLAGGAGVLEQTADGGLRVRSTEGMARVLVTDLTPARSPTVRLAWLDPSELLGRYGVTAALLARDPTLEARRARIEALGFRLARDFGTYLVFVRR